MRMNRIISMAVLTGFLALTTSFTSLSGNWRQDGNGWWYQYDDGSYIHDGIYEIGGSVYIFNHDGYILTNRWFQSPNTGDWYYCQGGGQVAKNKWIGNYYVGSEGKMLKDTWVGEYYVGSDGAWVKDKDKESTYSGSAHDLNSSAHFAKINGSSNETNSSSSFTKGWIYGFYNNVNQTGFYDHHCVQMNVYTDGTYNYDAMFYFSLYDIGSHNYDLYNESDPSGDILYGYNLGNTSQYLKSEINGKKYHMTYDGYDTIKIYWRDTSWLDEYDNCITLKKVKEYYTDRARVITMGNNSSLASDNSDSDSDDPFADRPLNITKSTGYYDVNGDLETADITVREG